MVLYVINLNTIHLKPEERWYKTRKPQLQIEVLACLALEGEMSKSEVESILRNHPYYHHDILKAFKKLEERKRIHISHSETGRGRRRDYYEITNEGLKLLITDNPDPDHFWKAMIGFCYHRDQVSLSVIDELYDSFVSKYLKYPSAYGYSFQVDVFNEMSDQWLQNIVLSNPGISCAQKIPEVLAINPGITLEKLVKEAGESVEEVQKAFYLYLPISHRRFKIGKEVKNVQYIKRDWKFFLHNTITVRTNLKNALVYELSLFGIMLVLTLIRHNDMDRLRHGMYYTDLTFQKYHDIIASNYKNKLPLIFGKWHLLKRTLKELSGYGFDIVLNKESRLKRFGEPVSLGGNKEYYDAALAIIQHSRKQLGELQIKGLMLYKTNQSSNIERKNIERKNNERKTEAIFSKLLEISTILNPQDYDPSSFKETFEEAYPTADKNAIEKMSQLYSLEVIERMFARDITGLYYLNLHNKSEYQLVGPAKYLSNKEEESMNRSLNTNSKKIHQQQNSLVSGWPFYSEDILLAILERDKEVRDWFSKWLKDLKDYQKETSEEMGNFYNKIYPE
jgi:DNA-binding MarR family transcriptional regulator